MTPAERRRRELLQLGVTHNFITQELRAWDALEVIEAHLKSLEPINYTHALVCQVWFKELLALLKRMRELFEREASKLKS
jgi:hypothetical protein